MKDQLAALAQSLMAGQQSADPKDKLNSLMGAPPGGGSPSAAPAATTPTQSASTAPQGTPTVQPSAPTGTATAGAPAGMLGQVLNGLEPLKPGVK